MSRVQGSSVGWSSVGWPPEEAGVYRKAGAWRGTSIWEEVSAALAKRHCEVVAVDDRGRWTGGDVLDAAATVAAALARNGLEPEDLVVLQIPNRVEFVVAWLGCLRAGITPVMALPMHRTLELRHLVQLTGAKAHLIVRTANGFDYAALSEALRQEGHAIETIAVDEVLDFPPTSVPEPVEGRGGDVAHLMVSGGSTGLPKLVARTHDDYLYNARLLIDILHVRDTTVALVQSPAAHNAALVFLILPALLAGARLVFANSSRFEDTSDHLVAERPTLTVALPATLADWIALPEKERVVLSSLEVVVTGAYRLPPEVGRRAHDIGLNVLQGFGMAEGFCSISRVDDEPDAKCATVGRPISDLDEVRICDEVTGGPVAAGTPGELQVRGAYTIRSYFNAAEANLRSFTPDGFLRTGDRALLDGEGRLVILGRLGEIINRGGEKINPTEVEDLLRGHPAIVDCVVVPLPDERLGQRAAVVAVARDEETLVLQQILEVLRDAGLARFKHPEVLVQVDHLPQTTAGKIDRRAVATGVLERYKTAVGEPEASA